jgi:hypothetical protein
VKRSTQRVLVVLASSVLAFVLWDTIVLWPLRLFVVFLHELSHGLAAVLTGGSILRIEISPNEGGVCWTAGGIRFVVLNAGYLGSLLFGALMLVASTRPSLARFVLLLLGAAVVAVTLLFVRGVFAFVYGGLSGGLLLWLARRASNKGAEIILQTVGTVSGLYALWDVATDVLLRSAKGSDAAALAELTGIPAVIWGIAWIGVSLAVLAWAFRRVAGRR